MKKPVVTIFDKKTATYSAPSTVNHVGDVIRDWDHLRKNKDTKIGMNPEDFDLFQVANYDEQSGEFENISPKLHLATGI